MMHYPVYVYLMKRTWKGYNQCRIGIAKNLSDRSYRERAAVSWVIYAFDTLSARFHEQLWSPTFGIPQTLWVGKGEEEQDFLDDLWGSHRDNWDRGKKFLIRMRKDENNPTWRYSEDIKDKNERRYKSWASLCNIDACKIAARCQSPNSCQGALDPKVVLL